MLKILPDTGIQTDEDTETAGDGENEKGYWSWHPDKKKNDKLVHFFKKIQNQKLTKETLKFLEKRLFYMAQRLILIENAGITQDRMKKVLRQFKVMYSTLI